MNHILPVITGPIIHIYFVIKTLRKTIFKTKFKHFLISDARHLWLEKGIRAKLGSFAGKVIHNKHVENVVAYMLDEYFHVCSKYYEISLDTCICSKYVCRHSSFILLPQGNIVPSDPR